MAPTFMIGDTTPMELQLKLTNYAETLEIRRRHHVRRISFIVTILDDEGTDDDGENCPHTLSEEDRGLLEWHERTENLQDDVEVRNNLTEMSGKICPYKNISLSLFDKVTDQQRIEPHPMSAYRHVTFRSAMLTKHSGHSASDGQVQLLFLHDGLPEDRSCLRWRSHDYIKLVLPKPRVSYRVFWLVQWDVVDLTAPIGDGLVATGRGIVNRRPPCSDHPTLERQGDSTGKFHGIRYSEKRKSPWIAEVRPKAWRGPRDKIWLGSYKTAAAAARAVDAGYYYFNLTNYFNFPNSPSFLSNFPNSPSFPQGLDEKGMEEFVKKEARRLVGLVERLEMPPLACNPDTRTEGFTFTSSKPWNIGKDCWPCNMQAATNANFASLPKGFLIPSRDSGSSRQTVGSPPEEHLRSTSNAVFAQPSSKREHINEASLIPVRNGEDMNDVFDVFPWDDRNDISGDTPTEIVSAGVSNANDLRQTFAGFDFDPVDGPNEDYGSLWLCPPGPDL